LGGIALQMLEAQKKKNFIEELSCSRQSGRDVTVCKIFTFRDITGVSRMQNIPGNTKSVYPTMQASKKSIYLKEHKQALKIKTTIIRRCLLEVMIMNILWKYMYRPVAL
jgi:hypothetical protein